MGGKDIKILILLVCTGWMQGCVKDKPQEHIPPATLPGNVFVVCEGTYGTGNGTLYSIPRSRDTAYGDLFKPANNRMLGDVFQSITKIDDHLFLCVNNSDNVLIINSSDLKLAATIHIPKPRYILPLTATKAYVSSLYSNKIYIINTRTFAVTDSILLPYENTEGMCSYNGTAFVCTWDTASNKVYKINTTTDQIIQPVETGGYAPQSVLIDKDHMLWVLAGNKTKGKTATLSRIDPYTGDILSTYQFPSDADPLKPVLNNTKDTLLFIEANYYGGITNNGIYRMGIHEQSLPALPFIAAVQYQYYWALGVEPLTGNIYVGDPVGFTQKGNVMIYRPDGTLIKKISVGVGPGSFYFGE